MSFLSKITTKMQIKAYKGWQKTLPSFFASSRMIVITKCFLVFFAYMFFEKSPFFTPKITNFHPLGV